MLEVSNSYRSSINYLSSTSKSEVSSFSGVSAMLRSRYSVPHDNRHGLRSSSAFPSYSPHFSMGTGYRCIVEYNRKGKSLMSIFEVRGVTGYCNWQTVLWFQLEPNETFLQCISVKISLAFWSLSVKWSCVFVHASYHFLHVWMRTLLFEALAENMCI